MQDERDLPADAQPAFDDDGKLRTDPGVEPGMLGPGDMPRIREQEQAAHREGLRITPGPAPTGEEDVVVEQPLVLDLNMNKIKLRELRGVERILAIVTGQAVPVLPMLEAMPADLMIALLAHKKLAADGIDVSRMNDTQTLEAANDIREAWSWAEEFDFGDLGSPPPASGEGRPPVDPTSGASGNGQEPSTSATSTSKPPS